MKLLFALLFIICGPCAAAESAPPCWPKQLGSTGSDFKQGQTSVGRWIGWTCTKGGVKTVYGAYALNSYVPVHPNVDGMTPTKAAQAYWAANVKSKDPQLASVRAAMEAAFK